jgi:hypothetical protein
MSKTERRPLPPPGKSVGFNSLEDVQAYADYRLPEGYSRTVFVAGGKHGLTGR